MKTAIIFDCEFLCLEGSQRRFWCAAHDPDPVIAQIGAVRLGLEGEFPILGTYKAYVQPVDRFGNRYAIDPFFTKLTGITEKNIEADGVSLQDALTGVDSFSEGMRFWSWGKDELNMVAISCYIAGIQPPIPAHRFDNAVKLLLAAGMPVEDLAKTPSNKLAGYYGIEHHPLQGHDALDDALSISYTLQHLMMAGQLAPEVFDRR
ncbi:exonuclease domain-containing protein [Rhizobium sp. VS19-DR104.2]|uniref:3'-5' exonuclease n=1 Tax=unclassified Rhizobium TaxID=2613769 RepID=UPI001C5A6FA6|nr:MULTISPECIES: 3'-5' exonuclease [unclassified Rhizobium]MBZ5763462.1 exonuclease domain-containing protein [Rhizobium sp. VS19-DR96]MBZ5769401.1 exonuclease domain-containing protein [Rhizobium sp. VS19-DR129.2]MBZ5777208.1 exonuclease domain-containing protein [Rhizobium sp. VS19-DRK62.2]MBZ5788025.1 exonuclease domain-containing protein [Rhizobium sp. VS19-DR121]MBZ5805516.1 exonuclease domain-containing protein [Rhizobium sp. VS19-DR181]